MGVHVPVGALVRHVAVGGHVPVVVHELEGVTPPRLGGVTPKSSWTNTTLVHTRADDGRHYLKLSHTGSFGASFLAFWPSFRTPREVCMEQ